MRTRRLLVHALRVSFAGLRRSTRIGRTRIEGNVLKQVQSSNFCIYRDTIDFLDAFLPDMGVVIYSLPPKVGDMLTATVVDRNGEDVSDNVTFQWYADDKAIEGATDETLDVTVAMIGSTIKVVVTAENGNTYPSEKTAEVEAKDIVITDVDQISADTILVTFDDDAATEGVTKDDILVSQIEDEVATLTIPVKGIEWSDDGTEATLTLAQPLTDDATYRVSYEESYEDFVASVGDVASVVVLTDKAQQNVETPIEFRLLDENGKDVTSTVKVSETITISASGDYTSVITNPTKPSITMDTVDAEATVTVTYNSNKKDAEDIPGEGTITCVEAEALGGKGIFKKQTSLKTYSDETQCEAFYKETPDEVESVQVDKTNIVYFCALNAQGDVNDYSAYDVESSNDDVVNVTMVDNKDTGKFCAFEITGVTVGTANINVKATFNGKDTFYRVPVVVTDKAELASITVTASRSPISNAIDKAYYGTITVKGKDTAGEEVKFTDAELSFELVDADKKEGDLSALDYCAGIDAGDDVTDEKHGFRLGTAVADAHDVKQAAAQNVYTAWGAKKGTYTVKVEATKEGITKEKKVNITVDQLAESAWYGKQGADTVYQIELGSNELDTAKMDGKETTNARLYATVGGLFAGYVRNFGAIGTGVSTGAHNGTRYTNETTTTGAGTLKFTASVNNLEVATLGTGLGGATITFDADPAKDGTVEYGGGAPTAKKLTFTDATAAGVLNGYALGFAHNADAAHAGIAVVTTASGAAITITADFSTEKNATEIANMLKGSSKLDLTVDGDAETALTAKNKKTIAAAVRALKVTGEGKVANAAGTGVVFDTSNVPAPLGKIAGFTAAKVTKANGVVVETDVTLPNIRIYFKGTVTVADIQKAIKNFATANKGNADAEKLAYITVGGTTASVRAGDIYKFNAVDAATTLGFGSIQTKTESLISDVTVGVKSGNMYSKNGDIYFRGDAATGWTKVKDNLPLYNGVFSIDSNTDAFAGSYFVPSNPTKFDYYYAAPGTYTVIFKYNDYLGKSKEKTMNFSVVNSFFTPSVDYTDVIVDSLDITSIRKVLKTDVDMNCNVSAYDSIPENAALIKTLANNEDGIGAEAEESNDKLTVKFIPIVEGDVIFYTSLDKTFKTE